MQAQHTQVRAGERRQSHPKDTPTKLRDTGQIVSTAQGQQCNVRDNESGELNCLDDLAFSPPNRMPRVVLDGGSF